MLSRRHVRLEKFGHRPCQLVDGVRDVVANHQSEVRHAARDGLKMLLVLVVQESRQGLRKDADDKVLKEKLSLSWTGSFNIIAVVPSSAVNQPDGRPLGHKLLYFDLSSNLSDPVAKLRVTVARCKPCTNPYKDMPRHLPPGLTQNVLHAFATKSPPYHVTTDDVAT